MDAVSAPDAAARASQDPAPGAVLPAIPVELPPLGASLVDGTLEVSVRAPHATRVDLCLVDVDRSAPTEPRVTTRRTIPLDGPVLGVWSARVDDVEAGQRYGFRVHGAWDPDAGLRHNPAKLLLDPYARGIDGPLVVRPEIYGHIVDDEGAGDPWGEPDDRDSAPWVPLGVVLPAPEPVTDDRPRVPWDRTVVYEAHVRGLTQQLESVPAELRGSYAALGHPATIDHLLHLGVTTLELLPIHASASEPWLVRKGMGNYWGYNTLGFFAPEPTYASPQAQEAGAHAVLAELQESIAALHAAGIEVLLDVVYNHTCEGGEDGPHLSLRGLDCAGYYLHDGGSPARLADVTGCGNTLDFRRPAVVALALDSLRYWSEVVGVDGFRFDLAVALGRGEDGFRDDHPFLVALQTDPVLSRRKLVAEPWDVGPGGWRTGQFPPPFAEWNDRYRDAVRQFWLTDAGQASHGRPGHGVRELATRLAGSVDLFGYGDPHLVRRPVASVNFITAHDGFTLADLVSYDHKHNEANREDNRDGSGSNNSWNHGVEGAVEDDDLGAEILPLRRRSMRNLVGTLLLSAGTPMLTAGDELGRTQHGNNNAYCQDNPISWLSWDLSPWRRDLLSTTRHLLHLRAEHPVLRPTAFYQGRRPDGRIDLAWFGAEGEDFDHDRWHDPAERVLQMLRTAPDHSPGSADALVLINGGLDPVTVVVAAPPPDEHVDEALGTPRAATRWELAWDSTWEHPADRATAAVTNGLHATPGEGVELEPLSMRLYLSPA